MMAGDDTRSRLRALLAEVLGAPLSDGEVSRETMPSWDSLRHVEVIFAVEEEFEVYLSKEEMVRATSLSALVELVEAHLAA
jgi:acyl carrier protein